MNNLEKKVRLFKLTTVIFGLLFVGTLFYFSRQERSKDTASEKESGRVETELKKSEEVKLDKSYEFETGQKGADFKVHLLGAAKVNLVKTQGEPITANKGKEFLLLALEIDNKLKQKIIVDSQNFFRLKVGEKFFAPDFYNGEIEILPISTKGDQLGFVVDEKQKNFELQVGEIDGKKEIVKIKF